MNHETLTIEMLQKARDKMDKTSITPALFISEEMIRECIAEGLIYERDGKRYAPTGLREIPVFTKGKL